MWVFVCTHMNERFSFPVEVCRDFLVLFIDICLSLRLSGQSCRSVVHRFKVGVGGFDSGGVEVTPPHFSSAFTQQDEPSEG